MEYSQINDEFGDLKRTVEEPDSAFQQAKHVPIEIPLQKSRNWQSKETVVHDPASP
jgi:hypothetical protein